MFAEKTLEILRKYVQERHEGVCSHASKELGINNDTLDKWLKGQRNPLKDIGPVIDKILLEFADPEKIIHLDVSYPKAQPVDDSKKVAELELENIRLKAQLEQSEKTNDKLLHMMQRGGSLPGGERGIVPSVED